MPVARERLKLKELFYDLDTYEIVGKCGKELFPDFDITQLEGALFGAGEYMWIMKISEQDIIAAAKDRLRILDQKKPFLKFQEPGQHYGYELFLSQPCGWYSRGNPFLWVHLAREFSKEELPMNEAELKEKYLGVIEAYHIPYEREDYVHVPEFSFGGMSSGMVGGHFIKESLEVLLYRNRKY